jgi:alkylhydroperoxidase family enzyme
MTTTEVEPSPSEPRRRLADLLAALLDAVLTSPGRLTEERRAAFAGEPLQGAMGAFAEMVRRHANTVTDDDVDALRRSGMDEDAVFELTIACAVGESYSRLQTGLNVLGHRG